MSEIMQTLFVVYTFITVIVFLCEVIYLANTDNFVTPIYIYENSEMNWFGCCFFFILLSIFSPFMFSMKIVFFTIACIYNFLDWLFHVGRKDD